MSKKDVAGIGFFLSLAILLGALCNSVQLYSARYFRGRVTEVIPCRSTENCMNSQYATVWVIFSAGSQTEFMWTYMSREDYYFHPTYQQNDRVCVRLVDLFGTWDYDVVDASYCKNLPPETDG